MHAQFDRIVDALTEKLRAVAGHLANARASGIRLVGTVPAEQHDEQPKVAAAPGLHVLARSRAVDTTDEEVTDEPALPAITA